MESLGVGIMNSTTFLLSSNSNSKVNGNQITVGAIDFQHHTPTLTPVFASLHQEMNLTIGSLNFCVGPLGSICLADPIKSGPSTAETASAAKSRSPVGSSSEVNLPVSFKPTENIEATAEELDEIMENLDLGNSSDHLKKSSDESYDNNHQPTENFMICCDNTSNKSTNTWKIRLELHEDDQTIFLSYSSKTNH
jgi:hypothetical protein